MRRLVRNRAGAAAPIFAVLLPLLATSVGVAADMGYAAITANRLQIAAEAAATAGGRRIITGSGGIQDEAVRAAAANMPVAKFGNVLKSSDVETGVWNAASKTFGPAPQGVQPNAIRVTTRRAAANGNAHRTLLGAFVGLNTLNLSATAIALAQTSCTPHPTLSLISAALPTRTAVVTMGERCLPGSQWTDPCYWSTPAGNPIVRIDNAFPGEATLTVRIISPSQFAGTFSFQAPRRGQFWVAVPNVTLPNTNSVNVVFRMQSSFPPAPAINTSGTATYVNKFNVAQTMPGTQLCLPGTERSRTQLVG